MFRPGFTVGCWCVVGPPDAAAARSDDVLPVEEEEGPESIRGAALHTASSTSVLRSGHPGVSGLLVSSTKRVFLVKHCIIDCILNRQTESAK